jgi:hypothetical protein
VNASRPPLRRCHRPAIASVLVLTLLAGGCTLRRAAPSLPAEADLEPDRLMLFVHGYMNDHETLASLVDVFTREGISREGQAPLRVHAHVFDFGRFSRAGDGHNRTLEDLVARFAEFYRGLPEHCPVCRRRAGRPVEVTLVGHSLGGILIRDFLIREARHAPPEAPDWHIARVVTLGTPFFGSFKTRFTQGFLSVVINGMVRTLLLGFVSPEHGGSFGNALDPQARALRIGSPYLWGAHERWRRHLEDGDAPMPPWLHVIGIGAAGGDGVATLSSANVGPALPDGTIESLLVNLRHGELVRMRPRGSPAREQARMLGALVAFMEAGTLRGHPAFTVHRPDGVEQGFFVQRPTAGDEAAEADLSAKTRRLRQAVEADVADVWLRFYERAADPLDASRAQAVVLEAPPSYFRTGVERSPFWLDLASTSELSADGELVPVVASLTLQRSHIVSIPDVTPTGPHRLHIRLSRGVVLTADHVRIVVDGDEGMVHPPDGRPGIPVVLRPLQANLVHVILDGRSIRAAHPHLEDLDVAEVALVPDR